MKKKGTHWKTEYLLLLCTGLFLCALFGLQLHDRAALQSAGAETERYAEIEPVLFEPLCVDLGAAGTDALEKLPGIGPELAQRILSYREAEGDFSTPEELMNVPGIGEKKFAALEEYITVNGGDGP